MAKIAAAIVYMTQVDALMVWLAMGGAPIEPLCASQDIEDFMDLEWLLEDIENGVWDE